MASITIRPATQQDVSSMLSVYFSAFSSAPFQQRCLPPSDPEVQAYTTSRIEKSIGAPGAHILVAESGSEPGILGWVRWVRRPVPSPHVILSPSDYPAAGDQALAARFFQANADASAKYVAGEAHWFLSTIVTAKEAQGCGVGSALMQFGVARADDEGWMAYVNSSEEGKKLYKKFGFKVVGQSEFPELGTIQYHMKREANKLNHE
ncbi:puromycin n-acetyltransferase [Fusarium albosuccineum]|uniref:Puromycin n-acetyltransferase n=1 Tax=Fusarium albosuccineum TaxID=1237068 RepID=A0A8H4LKU5_9HYPO|nr:puromycin n-acetyltransferase [Fusarium albosuccineum]